MRLAELSMDELREEEFVAIDELDVLVGIGEEDTEECEALRHHLGRVRRAIALREEVAALAKDWHAKALKEIIRRKWGRKP